LAVSVLILLHGTEMDHYGKAEKEKGLWDWCQSCCCIARDSCGG